MDVRPQPHLHPIGLDSGFFDIPIRGPRARMPFGGWVVQESRGFLGGAAVCMVGGKVGSRKGPTASSQGTERRERSSSAFGELL